jgi:2-polyprenyl-3-methyl-5-hydroxy-6-metoxy-1,4-benzoquinol methylase
MNYFKYQWNIDDVTLYLKQPYYQLNRNSNGNSNGNSNRHSNQTIVNILTKYKTIDAKYILDIGCGYTNFNYTYKQNLNDSYYTGIDIDYSIIKYKTENNNKSKNKYYTLDFSKDWDLQLNKCNIDIDSNYDFILCLNTIHNTYENFDYFCNKITYVANKNCILIIKFLNRTKLDKHLKNRISNDIDWVDIITKNKIKYYYSHTHIKPIIEYTFKDYEIVDKLNNWNLIEHNSKPIYDNDSDWDIYLKCFDILVFNLI